MSMEEIDPRQKAAATKRRRTNARIRKVARILFDERGYHGVTHDNIAAETGMGSSAVFAYFPTKRALAVAAYAPEVLELMASAKKQLANKVKPRTVLENFIDRLATYLYAHPAMAFALLPLSCDAEVPNDEPTLAVSIDDLAELLTRMLGRYQSESDAEFALFGMLMWIVNSQGRESDVIEITYVVKRSLL